MCVMECLELAKLAGIRAAYDGCSYPDSDRLRRDALHVNRHEYFVRRATQPPVELHQSYVAGGK